MGSLKSLDLQSLSLYGTVEYIFGIPALEELNSRKGPPVFSSVSKNKMLPNPPQSSTTHPLPLQNQKSQ